MKRKRYPIWKVLLTVIASWALCAILSLSGLYVFTRGSLNGLDESPPTGGCLKWWGDTDDPAAIEIGAHLKLPPSTQNLFADSAQSLQACIVYTSFDIAAFHLDSLLTSTNISHTYRVSGSELANFGSPLDAIDWTFNGKMTYLYGSGTSEGGEELQEIVIEQISSDTYTVYVVNHLD